MEYLCRLHDFGEYTRVRALLRRKGIPVHSVLVEGPRLGVQWALFVCLDEQLDDALRLLRDPEHVPRVSVDAAAFEKALDVPVDDRLAEWATVVAVVTVIGFVGVVCLVWWLRELAG